MNPFELYYKKFEALSEEDYYDRGVLSSEIFAFLTFCEIYDIDVIIESGTANGQSCYLFAKYSKCEVHTIDTLALYGENSQRTAVERCKDLPNKVNFHIGDSLKLLPQLVQQFSNKRVAVFIDGPKGDLAQQLRNQVLQYSNVKFAGVHDSEGRLGVGRFSTILSEEFLKAYQYKFDGKALSKPYPDDRSRTLRDRFPRGMGMDIAYKPREVVYAMYTGGQQHFIKMFMSSLRKHNPTCDIIFLTTEEGKAELPYEVKTIGFERGEEPGKMGPKLAGILRAGLFTGDKVLVLDVDLYFNGNPFNALNKDSSIIVTSRPVTGQASQYSPINGGVWGFVWSPAVEFTIQFMVEQLLTPTYSAFLTYKQNHPYDKTIDFNGWWVDQDLLNVLYTQKSEWLPPIVDVGSEYNFIVNEDQFNELKDKVSPIVLHLKGGGSKRWK